MTVCVKYNRLSRWFLHGQREWAKAHFLFKKTCIFKTFVIPLSHEVKENIAGTEFGVSEF